MKNQTLFSPKDKSKKLRCRLLLFLFCALRVITFCSISSQRPALFSLTAVKVHDSQAYRNMEMTWEHVSLIQ